MTLIAFDACAQTASMGRFAEDLEFQLEWGAYRNDDARLAIDLCSIGTCDQFVASNPNFVAFLRFVDIYVVFASAYVDFRSTSPTGRPPIPCIIERLEAMDGEDLLSADCGIDLTAASISCTRKSIAESLQIEKNFSRYDQGRNVVPEPEWVDVELSEGRIAINLRRYAGLGVSLPSSLRQD